MKVHNVTIEDTFAEAFRMWACRLIVTAIDERWLRIAANEVTGYGTSVIGCDAEAGIERWIDATQSPDGRPGVALLFFAFNAKALKKAMPNRLGQCLMTCPTTAVYDGMPHATDSDSSQRIDLGNAIRYFGDGHQKSKVIESGNCSTRDSNADGGAQRYWRIPVMDGEFTVADTVGVCKAIGGGNLLICGHDQRSALDAAAAAVDSIASQPNIITPFPGGVVRSGSKVGSRYKALFASTNDAFCPTLRGKVESQISSEAGRDITAVYEIVINGLTETDIGQAMKISITTACKSEGVVAISAGNYGGNLGKFHFKLRDVMASGEAMP